eukprot:TRINITY_DN11443_c0_g1_i1.p1 TRINITY_DN11443_c0_g1~~TRINITY_DN11443_c0_g1_i1.p1  ORF type:complete len:236 (+),score=46.77 TRINITY_DN11443_c0_g1_i1:39-710(+)
MTEAGPLALIEAADSSDSDPERGNVDDVLPGATRGDQSSRTVRPVVRTKCVRFSPTGRSWAAASTEGLLIYSLDDAYVFDPFDLDIDITPDTVISTLEQRGYLKALIMAFRLNEVDVLWRVFEGIPFNEVEAVASALPEFYLDRVLSHLATSLESTKHLEFHLEWLRHLFAFHGRFLKDHSSLFLVTMRNLHKSLYAHRADLAKTCEENSYGLDYIVALAQNK